MSWVLKFADVSIKDGDFGLNESNFFFHNH